MKIPVWARTVDAINCVPGYSSVPVLIGIKIRGYLESMKSSALAAGCARRFAPPALFKKRRWLNP
jgi:hypothetical protein